MNALFTAAQYRIPVVTVVLNNSVLGWVKDGQRAAATGHRLRARSQRLRAHRSSHGLRGRQGRGRSRTSSASSTGVTGAKEPIVLDVVTTEDRRSGSPVTACQEGPGGE